MEVNTPIALVCYERALPLPTSFPLMHNQLSDLTYLPEASEAHGTGLAAVQNVPVYKKTADFLSVWISSLHWRWLTLQVWCVYSAQCSYVPAARDLSPHQHTHTHTSTPAPHTRRPKGGKGTKEKSKPKKNQMTCTRLNEGGPGIWHLPQTISSSCCSLWRALSQPPVNGWSVDFLSNKG